MSYIGALGPMNTLLILIFYLIYQVSDVNFGI